MVHVTDQDLDDILDSMEEDLRDGAIAFKGKVQGLVLSEAAQEAAHSWFKESSAEQDLEDLTELYNELGIQHEQMKAVMQRVWQMVTNDLQNLENQKQLSQGGAARRRTLMWVVKGWEEIARDVTGIPVTAPGLSAIKKLGIPK